MLPLIFWGLHPTPIAHPSAEQGKGSCHCWGERRSVSNRWGRAALPMLPGQGTGAAQGRSISVAWGWSPWSSPAPVLLGRRVFPIPGNVTAVQPLPCLASAARDPAVRRHMFTWLGSDQFPSLRYKINILWELRYSKIV